MPHLEHSLEAAQVRVRLLEAVRRLPLTQRQTVTLCLEELSHREIAQVLESRKTTWPCASPARAELARLIGEST